MKKRFAVAGLGMSAAAFLGACAPTAPPATTTPPAGNTTTTSVVYACSGAGIIGPAGASPVGPIANQTTSVAITLPTTATAGVPFNVSVDVGNMALAPAPGFIDLNGAGVIAGIVTTGTNANPTVAANNFVGNGASINLNPAGTTATAASAGTHTVTAGVLNILAGGTGFVCTPVGAGASASVTVS